MQETVNIEKSFFIDTNIHYSSKDVHEYVLSTQASDTEGIFAGKQYSKLALDQIDIIKG